MLNIFITGAAAPGTSGTVHSILHGARETQLSVEIFGGDLRLGVPRLPGVSGIVQLPEPEDDAYIDCLNEVVDELNIDVVLPQTTREVFALAGLKDQVACHVVAPSLHAVETLGDKAVLSDLCRRNNLPHPRFFCVRNMGEFEDAILALGFPESHVVIKPKRSSGSRGVRIIRNREPNIDTFLNTRPDGMSISLDAMRGILNSADEWPELLVTEYVTGTEISVDGWRDSQGEVVCIPRSRDKIVNGVSFESTLIHDPESVSICLQLVDAVDFVGPFGFQFIRGHNGPMILECNPRVQGTMVASLASGNNIIWNAIMDSACLQEKSVPRVETWCESKLFRYWSFLIDKQS